MTSQLFKFAALAQAAIALLFILLSLTAGYKANFMENVHIIRFNMSEIGQSLVPDGLPDSNPVPDSEDCGGGILGKLCEGAGDTVDKVQDGAGDVVDKVAELAKDGLNIKDYYSIHLTDLCLGDFDADGDPLIDSCTNPFDNDNMNVLKKLTDQVKSAGIDLQQLGFVKELTDAFDKIPQVLSTTGYFFTAVSVLLTLCLVTTAGAAVLTSGLGDTLTLAAVVLAGLTWLLVLIGVLIITVVAAKISNEVNEKGNEIGIYASVGGVLMFLIWTGLLLITGVLGTLVLCLAKKDAPPSSAVDDDQVMYATKEMDSSGNTPSHSGEFNREHEYGQDEEGYKEYHNARDGDHHHEESDVGEGAGYYHGEDEHQVYSPDQDQYQHQDKLSPPPHQYEARYSIDLNEQGQPQYNRYSMDQGMRAGAR